jgi:hypothetical protein
MGQILGRGPTAQRPRPTRTVHAWPMATRGAAHDCVAPWPTVVATTHGAPVRSPRGSAACTLDGAVTSLTREVASNVLGVAALNWDGEAATRCLPARHWTGWRRRWGRRRALARLAATWWWHAAYPVSGMATAASRPGWAVALDRGDERQLRTDWSEWWRGGWGSDSGGGAVSFRPALSGWHARRREVAAAFGPSRSGCWPLRCEHRRVAALPWHVAPRGDGVLTSGPGAERERLTGGTPWQIIPELKIILNENSSKEMARCCKQFQENSWR